jgi:L-ascorbate metabolism protein UlaG (beta-lactamase superfamily)
MTGVRWIGHSTVLIETAGARLLTDPMLRPRLWYLTRRTPPPADVGAIDAVLISHVHHDHLDLPSLAALGGVPAIVAPRGAGALLRGHGLERVTELDEGEATSVAGVTIRATAARHRARRLPYSPWVPSLGFLLEGPERVYFAGDTDVYEAMEALAPLDLALLPVWGWGPKIGEGHLDPRTAAEALQLLRPRVAIPIHWGTYYPLWLRGNDRLTGPPHEFARHAAEVAPEVDVRILQPGESAVL